MRKCGRFGRRIIASTVKCGLPEPSASQYGCAAGLDPLCTCTCGWGGAQGAKAKGQTHQTAVGQLVNWYGVLRTVGVAATARDGLLKPLVVAHQKGWLKLGFGLLGGAQALSISQALPIETH